MFSNVASAVLGLALGLGAARVEAQRPRSFSLNLVREPGAESCIASQGLASLLEQWVGPVFVAAGEGEFAVEALVRRDGSHGWKARVAISDAGGGVLGARELKVRDASCRALDRPLVLVIALAIDPEFALRGLPDELLQTFPAGDDPGGELLRELKAEAEAAALRAQAANEAARAQSAAEVTPPATQPAASFVPEDSVAPRRPWRWEAGVGLVSGVGMLPRVASGPGITLGAEPPWFWPLVVSAALWLENDAQLAEPTPRGDAIHFTMFQTGLSVCPHLWRARPWQLRLCGGVLAEYRSVDSGALEAHAHTTRVSIGPAVGPELGFSLGDAWWLSAALSARASFGRDTYTYLDQFGEKHSLFQPAAVAVTGHVGLSLRL